MKLAEILSLRKDLDTRISKIKELLEEIQRIHDDICANIDKMKSPSLSNNIAMHNMDELGYMLEGYDPLFIDASRFMFIKQIGSTTLLQRKYYIGYNRAARIMDQLEKTGIVGYADGSKPREVLVKDEADLNRILASLKKCQ